MMVGDSTPRRQSSTMAGDGPDKASGSAKEGATGSGIGTRAAGVAGSGGGEEDAAAVAEQVLKCCLPDSACAKKGDICIFTFSV